MAALNTMAIQQADPKTIRISPSQMIMQAPAFRTILKNFDTSDLPIFTETPNRVDRTYVAQDGTKYYIPHAGIAKRKNNLRVPDIAFDHRQDTYTLLATFDLVRNTAVAADAKPLPIDNLHVTLQPSAGSPIVFDVPESATGGQQLNVKAVVDRDRASGILSTDLNAQFQIYGTVHYRFQPPAEAPPADDRTDRRESIKIASVNPAISQPISQQRVMTSPSVATQVFKARPIVYVPPPPTLPPPTGPQTISVSLTPDTPDGLRAYFNPQIPDNRPIFADVMEGFGVDPDAMWVPSQNGNGYFKPSVRPNQYYVLPDRYGLAFDAVQDLPAMSVLLVKGSGNDATYRARVRFVVTPYLDPDRIEKLRTELRKTEDVPFADLVISDDKALFFPSLKFQGLGQTVVGDAGATSAGVEVSGGGSFELVLDCTMEFYTLLTKLLTKTEEGLDGTVRFTIKVNENPTFLHEVPVSIRLDKPANHPLTTQLDISPNSAPRGILISNPSKRQVSVGRIFSALLVPDENMPYAAAAVPGNASPSKLDIIAPGAQNIPVALTPQTPLPWSGVAVSFDQVHIDLNATEVLDKVHELSGSSAIRSDLHVWSIQLQHPEFLPDTLKNLLGIHLQVRKGSGQPIDIFLTRDTPQKTVQVAFSLADIVAGMSPDQPVVEWRRANILTDKTEDFSNDWQTNTGSDLVVPPHGL